MKDIKLKDMKTDRMIAANKKIEKSPAEEAGMRIQYIVRQGVETDSSLMENKEGKEKDWIGIMGAIPTLLTVAVTGMILSLMAWVGKSSIYGGQEYHFMEQPALVMVFQGINEAIYPWQMVMNDAKQENGQMWIASTERVEVDYNLARPELDDDGRANDNQTQMPAVSFQTSEGDGVALADSSASAPTLLTETKLSERLPGEDSGESEEGVNREANGENMDSEEMVHEEVWTEILPLRSSTQEEYANHISADIYGTSGIDRARAYAFTAVQEDYFDDALFIGDSRMVGLRDYSSVSEHGDFLCETALTVYKVMESDIDKSGTVEEALVKKEYGKIYLSVGINEVGTGTTEYYLEQYKAVVDQLKELEPEAIIFIQGVMKVSKDVHEREAVINNSNIEARNRAIATLADNQTVFYIDVNEVMCDADGNLRTDYTHDGIHLLAPYDETYKQFLLAHGVTREDI